MTPRVNESRLSVSRRAGMALSHEGGKSEHNMCVCLLAHNIHRYITRVNVSFISSREHIASRGLSLRDGRRAGVFEEHFFPSEQ